MVAITQSLVAAIMAFGAVQALPQQQAQATPQPAAPAAVDNTALFLDLLTAPTAVKRFQMLLVKGGDLLKGTDLAKLVVFSFNGATPAADVKGGVTKAAVCPSPFSSYLSSTNIH
jgi:hypothetical protein